MKIIDRTFMLLDRALDVRSTKHQHLSHTLANVDTPGFRPTDVDFADSLDAMLRDDDAAAARGRTASITDDTRDRVTVTPGAENAPNPDGNTVDLDRTMAALAENQLMYDVTTRLAKKRFALLRYVVGDGIG